jgi:hypothetical protein
MVRNTMDSTYSITVDDHFGWNKVLSRSGCIYLHFLDGSRTISATEGLHNQPTTREKHVRG